MMAYNWLGNGIFPLCIAYGISFVALVIGSITDLKTREVPDWINYGLIISGIILNLLFSVIFSNPYFIINSIVGLLILFGIAYLMFYAGQWGGGDSKILMGLGAMIGIDLRFRMSQFLFAFLITALLIGALYGLFWSIFLVFRNRKKFWKQYSKMQSKDEIIKSKKILLSVLVLFWVLSLLFKYPYVRLLSLSVGFLIVTTFYLWVFIKSIEKSCMHKLVEPSKLTEGDWIVKDVFVDKKYICGPKDLGIDKKQINQLVGFYKKGKVKRILIKEGIPFVPSFLITFAVTFVFGNPMTLLIGNIMG